MPTAPLLAEVTRLYANAENGYTARDVRAALSELFSFEELRTPQGMPSHNLVELGESFQQALIDYAPTYFEQKAERDALLAAEQAELLREPTAAERLEAITVAARNGEAVTTEQFAVARAEVQAEADLAEITAAGQAERAEKAATSRRVQNKARAAAKKNPPVAPKAELDAALADAKAAIDRLRGLGREYRDTIVAVKADFTAAGVKDYNPGDSAEEQADLDWENHAFRHQNAVRIDDVLYDAATTVTPYFTAVAKYAELRN